MNTFVRTICFLVAIVACQIARGQASAVDAIGALGGIGPVDTTWLNNTNASGIYQTVYTNSSLGGPSGPLPPGMPAPSTNISSTSTTYNLYLNTTQNLYYIRRRITSYICGGGAGSYWGEIYYSGPVINSPPYLDVFSAAPSAVILGAQSTVTAIVKDDSNLTEVRLKHLPPGTGATWVDGTSASGSLWTGTGGSNVTLAFNRTYNLVGTWRFRLTATDTRVENALAVERDLIRVSSITYYDPTGVYGTTFPALTNTAGAGSAIRAGQSSLIPVEFTITGATAGKPVRVSVGAGGGKLFTTSTPSGAGADALELTTSSSGKVLVYYQTGNVAGAIAGIYALAGLSFAKLELSVGLPSASLAGDYAGAADDDGDGMPTALEQALSGGTNISHTGTNPVSGFAILNP